MCSAKNTNKIAVAVAILSMVVLSEAAQFYTMPKIHPDHPRKCHWPEMLSYSLVPGQRVTGPGCVRLTCLPNFAVLGSTCPQMEDAPADMECVEVPGDADQEYPACCPRLKCIQKIDENELF